MRYTVGARTVIYAIWFEDVTRNPNRLSNPDIIPARGMHEPFFDAFTRMGIKVLAKRYVQGMRVLEGRLLPAVLSGALVDVKRGCEADFQFALADLCELLGTIAWIRSYEETHYAALWDSNSPFFGSTRQVQENQREETA